MRPISGRLRASVRKRWVCSARYSGEPPLRSCSSIVKPAPVPSPGMDGGPNATTPASGIVSANARFRAATTPFECVSSVVRSSHGLSWTKKKPMFDEYAPVSMLKPVIVLKPSMASFFSSDGLRLAHDGIGTLERRGVRQQHVHQQIALVLLGHESTGNPTPEHDDQHAQDADEEEAPEELPNQHAGEADVDVRASAEDAIEPVVERGQQRLLARSAP